MVMPGGAPAMNFATVDVAEDDGAIWAINEGMRLKLPAGIAARLRGYVGEQVMLGIRPEDLRVASSDDPAELCFGAILEVVEKLGPQILLNATVGSGMMVAAVPPNVRAEAHQQVRLVLNPERLHFFDGSSGSAI